MRISDWSSDVCSSDLVVKTYGKDLTVRALRGVSLTVGEHEVVALLGRSGSGKSTLLRCINRLVEPEAGRIVFRDIDITSLSGRPLRHIRRRIGMVFQEFNLVNQIGRAHV